MKIDIESLAHALILAFWVVVSACAGRVDTARGARANARVLVYNIHAGKDAAGVDNLERVAALVRETRADLVLLQEVDRGTRRSGGVDQVATLERATGLRAAFGRTLDYDGGQYGIALLSRWPIGGDTLVPLRVDPPQQRAGGSYEPRGALVAQVAIPDVIARVVNTHLDASGQDHYRRQEIASMQAIVAGLRGRLADSSGMPALVVAGGDFNAEPGSAVHAAAVAAGWRDAWLECGDGTPGLTFPAKAPVKRIDYLWLTGTTRCTSARVVGGEVSDHRGLLVTVRP